jgi:uridine kinase
MDQPHGIILFGVNGSGKTTLGRELARLLNYKHMDIEDYYFEKSEIPYTVARSPEDCINLMIADIEKYRSFVITAVTGDFGDIIPQWYELAIHISAPLDLRLKRIEQRGYEQYGDRVLEGGDMYEQSQKFMNFVASRSLTTIEKWEETLICPVIHIDGKADWRTNATKIKERFYE